MDQPLMPVSRQVFHDIAITFSKLIQNERIAVWK